MNEMGPKPVLTDLSTFKNEMRFQNQREQLPCVL